MIKSDNDVSVIPTNLNYYLHICIFYKNHGLGLSYSKMQSQPCPFNNNNTQHSNSNSVQGKRSAWLSAISRASVSWASIPLGAAGVDSSEPINNTDDAGKGSLAILDEDLIFVN